MTRFIHRNVPAMWNTREEFITPFSQLFDKIVEQHFPEFKEDFAINFAKGSYPKVDVIDRQDSIEIVAEVAGWRKEDINVDVDKGVLTITGNNVVGTKPVEDGTYIVKEIKRSSFARSFQLNKKLDPNKITATFENGTLVITIDKVKPEEVQTKKSIEII